MQKKARVLNISPQGDILLRCSDRMDIPKKRLGVYDNRNRKIADVRKIFGPTTSPFIKARPFGQRNRLIGMIGKVLFLK